jgi:hypothetical protein
VTNIARLCSIVKESGCSQGAVESSSIGSWRAVGGGARARSVDEVVRIHCGSVGCRSARAARSVWRSATTLGRWRYHRQLPQPQT